MRQLSKRTHYSLRALCALIAAILDETTLAMVCSEVEQAGASKIGSS